MWLRLENVHCTRGDGALSFTVEVPRLSVRAGELLAVTGPNGSGKSTLLEILGLLLRPAASGTFRWRFEATEETVDIAALWQMQAQAQLARLRSRSIGFVLQSGGLLPFLNVRENISLPRQLAGQKDWSPAVEALVESLDVTPLLTKKPKQLSIGERQRVAVVRALAHDPLLLLADEPTAALDNERAEQVLTLIAGRVREQGRMGIIVTHDYGWIRSQGLQQVRARLHPTGSRSRFYAEAEEV